MLRFFNVIGNLEGISYLVLFFNMLVIKRMDINLYKELLYPIGMAHGLLFVLYMVLLIMLKIELKWSWKKSIYLTIASLLPFGTFYSKKYWVNKNF